MMEAGISPSNQDRVFDAFFTTKREQGGTGMGLGIVRAMLRAHGGSIRLLPDPEEAHALRSGCRRRRTEIDRKARSKE